MNNKTAKGIIIGVLGGLGIIFIIVSAICLALNFKIKNEWVPVQAVITEVDHYEKDACIQYEYLGKTYDTRLNSYSSGMDEGDVIDVYVNPKNGKAESASVPFLIGCIFGAIGVISTIAGIIITCKTIRESRKYKDLMANGITVYAEIAGMNVDYRYAINDHHPWIITAKYTDEYTGESHEFKSTQVWKNPTLQYKVGDTIRVKVRSGNYSEYVFDLTGLGE